MEDDTENSYRMMEMSQDCIVWDESRNRDLRELARSPMEFASAGNGASRNRENANQLDSIKRRLEKGNNAPEQEIDGIFRILEEQSTSPPVVENAQTQPTGNSRKRQLPSSARRPQIATSSLASRRRQKKREGVQTTASHTDSQCANKRQNLFSRRRRRVTNSFSDTFTSPCLNPTAAAKASALNNDGAFEELLKEFSTPQSTEQSRTPLPKPQTSEVNKTNQCDPIAKNLDVTISNRSHHQTHQTLKVPSRAVNETLETSTLPLQSQPITPTTDSVQKKDSSSSNVSNPQPVKNCYRKVLPPNPVHAKENAVMNTSSSQQQQQQRNLLSASNPYHCNNFQRKTGKTAGQPLKQTMPPPSITPVGLSKPTSLVSNEKEDDEFGKFDFGAEEIANLDSLLSMKSSHQSKEPVQSNETQESRNANLESKEETGEFGDFPDINFDAIDQALAVKSNLQAEHADSTVERCRNESIVKPDNLEANDDADEFGDFPDMDFDAIDQAIAVQPNGQLKQAQSTKHEHKTETPSRATKNLELKGDPSTDEFGDFPDIDFDAIDQVIAQRDTVPSRIPMTCNVSPNGPVKNPRRAVPNADQSFMSFTRYKVLDTFDDVRSYTKTLSVATWTDTMLKDEENEKLFHRNCKVTMSDGEDKGFKLNNTDTRQSEYKADGLLHLRGEWYHTPICPGDVVHLCSISGSFQTEATALPIILHNPPPPGSDNDDLVLVIHPDILMTPTAISDTVTCSRRAVLKSRIGSTGLSSRAPLFGTMRHDLFGLCMRQENFDKSFAKRNVHKIVRQNAESLLGAGVGTAEAEQEILKVLPVIRQFVAEYTALGMSTNDRSISNTKIIEGHGYQSNIHFLTKRAHSIEEPIVSSELALKGNIDAVLEANTLEIPNNYFSQDRAQKPSPRHSLMCLELKTGHNQNTQNAHMAQLALYTLMLQSRYGSESEQTNKSLSRADDSVSEPSGASTGGVLLYLNHESMRSAHVAPLLNETKSLIGQRNVVASGLYKASRPRGVVLTYDDGDRTEDKLVLRSATLLPPPPADLPDVMTSSFACKKCYVNRECMLYAASEARNIADPHWVTGNTHKELLSKFTGNLKDEDLSYFRKWDRLIDLEADASTCNIATAWLTESQHREREKGESVSSLIFDHPAPSPTEEGLYVLIAFRRGESSQSNTPLENLSLSHGCRVIISTDGTSLVDSTNSVRSGKRQTGKQFRHQMHIVRGIMEKVEDGKVYILAKREDLERIRDLARRYRNFFEKKGTIPQLLFRLDKDNSAVGIGTLRQNLINFFTADFAGDGENQPSRVAKQSRLPRLRDIVVRLTLPRFNPRVTSDSLFNVKGPKIPGCEMESLSSEFSHLNPDQKTAVVKVISACDYALLQGLPGTGKTTTLAYVARLLAARGKRVLITSYTHAAVDNVVLKLIEKGVASLNEAAESPKLIRIGQRSSCHPGVRSLIASEIATLMDRLQQDESKPSMLTLSQSESYHNFDNPSVESLRKVVSSARIVCASALSVPRSPLLTHENFDVVIIDEAGQISQPAILGALSAADSFVLVGDHKQLPPLVNSELAESGGYGVSMLQRLAEKYPNSIATLTYQYRMNEAICRLSSEAVYGGRLKCGNEKVRTRTLTLTGFPTKLPPASSAKVYPWLKAVVDPKKSVVFVDTDNVKTNPQPATIHRPPENVMEGLEGNIGGRRGGNVINKTEATLVRIILNGLFSSGVLPTSVGVISPFRAQVRLFEDDPSIKSWKTDGLELSTIDRYQGRDKDVIILSTVRSNSSGRVGRLLLDMRRLNVALTRAKCKLIIVGSFSTLSKGSDPLRPLLARVNRRGQRFLLPENAVQCYKL